VAYRPLAAYLVQPEALANDRLCRDAARECGFGSGAQLTLTHAAPNLRRETAWPHDSNSERLGAALWPAGAPPLRSNQRLDTVRHRIVRVENVVPAILYVAVAPAAACPLRVRAGGNRRAGGHIVRNGSHAVARTQLACGPVPTGAQSSAARQREVFAERVPPDRQEHAERRADQEKRRRCKVERLEPVVAHRLWAAFTAAAYTSIYVSISMNLCIYLCICR